MKLVIFLISLIIVNISLAQPFSDLSKPILIAHAGGALNGKTYLNSKEAVNNAIKNNFQYIELDLMETSDHEIVAAHDWKHFNKITNHIESDLPLSLMEVKKRKILDSQNVLTTQEIRDIFTHNKNLYLVTDKIQNVDLLLEKFGDFKDRIIMEVFSMDKYNEALSKGILYPAYCIWNSEKNYIKGIKIITLSSDKIENRIDWYKQHHNVIAFAFSIGKDKKANSIENIKNLFPYINAWYTDFLTPQDIQ